MIENVVTGKKYRILTDASRDVWDRVSFWTKSSDVQNDDGSTAEYTHQEADFALYNSNGEHLLAAYIERGSTYSYAYPYHQVFAWKGSSAPGVLRPDGGIAPTCFFATTRAVTAGEPIQVNVNCVALDLSGSLHNISTYVGGDGKLYFRDFAGADSVLNFSNKKVGSQSIYADSGSGTSAGDIWWNDVSNCSAFKIVRLRVAEDGRGGIAVDKTYINKRMSNGNEIRIWTFNPDAPGYHVETDGGIVWRQWDNLSFEISGANGVCYRYWLDRGVGGGVPAIGMVGITLE